MDVAPVDLHLRVQTRRVDGGTILDFDLSSPSGRVPLFRHRGESDRLPADPSAHASRLFADLEELLGGERGESRLVSQEVEERLRKIGKNLYRHLLPSVFREVFDAPRSADDLSLLVETDETWIPWELLHTLGDSGDFLCLRYRLGRWLTSPRGPVSSFGITRYLCVDAGSLLDRPDLDQLPQTAEEAKTLRDLANRTPNLEAVPLEAPRYDLVMERLRAGGFQLLHFAGHGDFPSERSADRAELLLDQQNLEAMDLVDEVERRMLEDRPLVFLNACRTSQQGESLTGLGGWPRMLVDTCGCGALLSPQWIVKSGRAFEFAGAFYSHLEAGLPVGEAVRRGRTSPTHAKGGAHYVTSLAYVLYGHPNALVGWGESVEAAATPDDELPVIPYDSSENTLTGSGGEGPALSSSLSAPPRPSRSGIGLIVAALVLAISMGAGFLSSRPLEVSAWPGPRMTTAVLEKSQEPTAKDQPKMNSSSSSPVEPEPNGESDTYEIYLVLPSVLEGATILVDGETPRILKQSGTFVLIEVLAKDGNHRIEVSKDDRICPPIVQSIGPDTRRIPISC